MTVTSTSLMAESPEEQGTSTSHVSLPDYEQASILALGHTLLEILRYRNNQKVRCFVVVPSGCGERVLAYIAYVLKLDGMDPSGVVRRISDSEAGNSEFIVNEKKNEKIKMIYISEKPIASVKNINFIKSDVYCRKYVVSDDVDLYLVSERVRISDILEKKDYVPPDEREALLEEILDVVRDVVERQDEGVKDVAPLTEKERFKHAQEMHNARFRRMFRREPDASRLEDYTVLDHVRQLAQGRGDQFQIADLSREEPEFYKQLDNFRHAQNRKHQEASGSSALFPYFVSLDAMILEDWPSPVDRVFGGRDDDFVGPAASVGDRERPTYDDPTFGFKVLKHAYTQAFFDAQGRMPERARNEIYSAVDFVNEVWGDMIEHGTLSGPLLKQHDPALHRTLVNFAQTHSGGDKKYTIGDFVSEPDHLREGIVRRAFPSASPTTQISDVRGARRVEPDTRQHA